MINEPLRERHDFVSEGTIYSLREFIIFILYLRETQYYYSLRNYHILYSAYTILTIIHLLSAITYHICMHNLFEKL